MALEGKCITEGAQLKTASNLSAKQFCAVKISGDGLVDLASTGGEAITGILQNDPTAGQPAIIAFAGFPKVIAGTGGFTAGDLLMTEAGTGRLITKTGTNTVVAVAVNSAAAGVFGCVKLLATG